MINDNDIKNNFGSTLKMLRLQSKITQEQLAEFIELQPQTIAKIETGRLFVSCETLAKLCNFFKVKPAIFFNNKFQTGINDKIDYTKEVLQIFPSLSKERQKDIYKIILALEE